MHLPAGRQARDKSKSSKLVLISILCFCDLKLVLLYLVFLSTNDHLCKMNRQIICIECPHGCVLDVDIENDKVIKVIGNKCPKGEIYANSEVQNPVRFFTSTVLCLRLDLKMLPVRTTRPIPKAKLLEAGMEVKKIRITNPVSAGQVIENNFLGLGVDLVATRSALAGKNE